MSILDVDSGTSGHTQHSFCHLFNESDMRSLTVGEEHTLLVSESRTLR
jgi:hypothetical protein